MMLYQIPIIGSVLMWLLFNVTASDQVQAIESGIEDLARASCVKFRPYRKGDRDAVVIQVLYPSTT